MFDFFRTRFLVFVVVVVGVVVVFFFFEKRTKAFVQRMGWQALHNSPQDQKFTLELLANFHGYKGRSLTNFFSFKVIP